MALLSFRGISTPSLPAQGEQRRSSYFNIPRGNFSNIAIGYLGDSGAYWKYALYRDATNAGTAAIWYANMETGTADLSARTTNPRSHPF
jgi:hypothetical protein